MAVISFGNCAFFAAIELLSHDPVKSGQTWLLTAQANLLQTLLLTLPIMSEFCLFHHYQASFHHNHLNIIL